MYNIGYVSATEEWKKEYSNLFDKNKFTVNHLKDTDRALFCNQQALLIENSCLEDIPATCQILIQAEKIQGLFVYVVTSLAKIEPKTKIVYLQLGANGIKDSETTFEEFCLIVSNTLLKTNVDGFNVLPLDTGHGIKQKSKFQLKANNLSLVLSKAEISLTKLEYQIIDLLYRNMGNVVTYSDIYKTIWDVNGVDDNGKKFRVANIIFHLRRKMMEESHYIKTVRSKGYMLKI